MDVNSPKPPQTGFDKLEGIRVLRDWLDREGGNRRIPQVLDLLADKTARAWATDQASPAVDPDTLRQLHAETHGERITDMLASRWLSSSGVRIWWGARKESLEQAFSAAKIPTVPSLSIISGGGRGNATLYRLDFEAVVQIDEINEEASPGLSTDAVPRGVIHYQVEPAKAAWWLQAVIGSGPFRMRGWRGYLLIGIIVSEALCLLLLWLLALLSMRGLRPVSAGDLAYLLAVGTFSYLWFQMMKPLIRLPAERVTSANDALLAYAQFHAQFKLVRDAKSKVAGGWFQLVRHHGTCHVCSGEVEVVNGGNAFPERLIGRCGDSPLEHVFSFDPVLLKGQLLYQDCISSSV